MRTYPVQRPGLHAIGRQAPFGRGDVFKSTSPLRRLAQAAAQPTQSAIKENNRLLDLTVGLILGRRAVATAYWRPILSGGAYHPVVPITWPYITPAQLEAMDAPSPRGLPNSWVDLSAVTGVPVPALKTLMAAALDSSAAELDDARRVDAYFGEQVPSQGGMSPEDPTDMGPWLLGLCKNRKFDPKCLPGNRDINPWTTCPARVQGGITSYVTLNDFWCPSGVLATGAMPRAVSAEYTQQWHWKGGWPTPESPKAVFWGITLTEPWSTVKPWLPNMERADKILLDFPFPAPFGEYVMFWTQFAVPELRAWIRLPIRLSEESIRAFITFSVLAHYEEMSIALEAYLKKRAKSFARNQLMKTIAAVAISVIGLAAGVAVAAGAAGALWGAKAEMDKIDFETEMAKVANAFESTDPAFAQEVRNAKDWAQKVAAQGTAVMEAGAGSGLLTIGLAAGSAAVVGITIALLLGGK
jgi:hypothetical protein